MSRPLRTFATFATLAFAVALPAQTLARPHWAGSGVTSEPWWLRGVFYRIDPARFQDSDGDGRGDLPGIAQRLSYIQSLGVDAIILDPGMDGDDTATVPADDFGTLARGAANYRLRLMVALPLEDRSHHLLPDQVVLAATRRWLSQGAAGVLLDSTATRALSTDPARAIGLLRQLRVLFNSVPGDRVLIASAARLSDANVDHALDAAAQLRAGLPIGERPTSAAVLRSQLTARLPEDQTTPQRGRSSTAAPMLQAARPPSMAQSRVTDDGLNRTLATALLGSRAAVLIDFGQEVGEQSIATGSALMQWTPTNLTLPPPPKAAPEPKKPVEEFGAYHPYIPPPPNSLLSTPHAPEVVLADAAPTTAPELMPGFTPIAHKTEASPQLPANGATANVLSQDSDTASLLNLYRRLIQLHHGDPTLHNGAAVFLQYDALNALVWVRRAPASVRTSYDIIVICSLSAQPAVLFLEDDLAALHVRPGALRNLISSSPSASAVGTTAYVKLPPNSVFLGELYR